MTLRELLMAVDLEAVLKLINKRDRSYIAKSDRATMEQTTSAYIPVVKELLSKPRTRAYKLSWLIEDQIDLVDNAKYVDVCFLNPKYIAPKKGLKPWGCTKRGQLPPKGYYNCNADVHNRTFASGWTPWSSIIDTPIINNTKHSLEKIAAEMLWEMTFYGWTEEKSKSNIKDISKKIKSALKEVKDGKCIKLPRSKKGGFDVVIPDSVSQQIVDIANKYPKCER